VASHPSELVAAPFDRAPAVINAGDLLMCGLP
jgi:hypothetical protein